MSRAPSNLISLDDIDAALNDPTTQEPVARQDLPIYQGRGGIRKDAKDAMRPYATSLLEEAYGAATSFSPLPKWYTDFGGSVLKSVEGFAGSVGQGLGDLASTLSGGLIDLTGSSVDKSRAYDLLRSDDPELRVQGQRLIDQARTVEDATREGFRLEMQRNRETPLPGVDPDSWASTAGNIVGSVAPSIAALVPGMQAPVLAGYFSNSYESAYDQYADTKIAQTGGYDTTTAATVGVISGAIEAAMEFLPIMGIKKASAAARQALVESAMSGSANWRAQAAKQVAKLVGLGAAQEGAEEGTTELAGEILRLTYDEQLREKYKNDPTTAALEAAERITKAALASAVGGGLLGGAGFGTALAGSESGVQPTTPAAAPQSTQAAPDTEPLPMIEVEPEAGTEAPAASGEVDTGPSVPLTEEDESIKAQAAALRGGVGGVGNVGGVATAGSSDLMQAAFGMRNVEVGKAGRETMRVARPEAIAALRAAGKIPTTQDPFDFMHEVASEPERYAEFIDALRANPDMSRGQADALFGEENAKALFENAEGDKAQRISAKERRKIWVESTLELADSNALGIGPSPQSNVPLPPESAGKGRPAQPADNRIVFADDVWTRFQESQLDELEKLVKLQNAVLAETGAKELPDRDNPEMAMRLAKSKRRYEQERFHNGPNGAIPTLREMAEKRITPWRVGRLAAALHAEEANQQVAKLNPDDPTVGYGLSNDEARKIIAQEVAAPDSALVFKFAAWLSDRMEERTSLDQVAGVVSAKDVAQMRAVYSSFVTTQDDPDFVDHDADVAGMSSMPRNAYSVAVSQRLNRLGRAYGSLDDPNNPRARALFDGMFAHTIEAYERGILRRSQNHVLNTLRRFADRTEAVQAGLTVRFEPPFVRKMNRATGEVETDKEALSAYKARPDVLYGKLDEEVTIGNGATLLPGTPFFIEVADAKLADTLKTVKTEEAMQAAVLGALRAGAGLTRFFATSILNPAFAPAGLARDLQTAITTIATEHDDLEKAKRDYVKGVPQSFAAVLRNVVGKPGTGEFDRYYEEMKAAGGTQEMFAMSDFDKSKAVVKSVIEPTVATKAKDAFDTFVDMTSRLTKPTEDGARLSFYVLARKRGWTPEKAALAARKLTLDFQIHGKDTRTLRAGWAFLNASVQGQRKIVRMLRTPTGKRIAGMYFLAGFINAVASYLVLDDDENKDGKPDSAQIPPWERDTYVRIPGLGVQIPTMWGMQPALSAGWWMGEAFAATMGKADVDHAANAAAFGNAILDGFNPAGGSDAFSVNGLANLVSPSLTDMAVQSAMNKDWRGNQLANAPIGRKQALTWVASQHPFETTPEMFVNAAQFMNRWTGGDESTSGFVDVAPETIRHVVSSLFGGGYRTLEKIGGVVGAPYTGDLKTWMDLPIVDTFTTKTPDPKAVNAEYAKYEDISTRYLARIKAYEDSNNFEALRAFLSESDDLAMMSMIVEPTRKNIESMREMLRETDDASLRRSLLESIQLEREAAMGLIRSGLRRR